MSERPSWIPEHITDEEIQDYADSLGGQLARIESESTAAAMPGMLARADQARTSHREQVFASFNSLAEGMAEGIEIGSPYGADLAAVIAASRKDVGDR